MDPWLTLVFAGLFEVGFTTCLKLEERNKGFIVPFLICAGISFTLLSQALQSIPLVAACVPLCALALAVYVAWLDQRGAVAPAGLAACEAR